MPAAPAPDSTIRTSGERACRRPCSALMSAASTTIAVPCWSSWKTGMSRLARSRRSISKQRGAEMSSRLMPAKTGAISSTVAHDLVDVLGVEADREGVDAGEPLEQRRLALHHRQRGDRAEVAQPEHRRAVGDDRDGVALDGQPAGVARGSRRAPGRPGRPRACRSSTGRRGCGSGPWAGSRSCRRGASGRSGRRPCRWSRPSTCGQRLGQPLRRARCRWPRRSRRSAAARARTP